MRLSYNCSSCKKENHLKTNAQDRYAFLQEYGDYDFKEKCKHCGNVTKKSINRLYAEPNKIILIGGLVLGIVVTLFLLQFSFISLLTLTIPIGVWVNQNNKTSIFNKSRVK